MAIRKDNTAKTTTNTWRGTSLRVVEARAGDGDTITDSTLIAQEPNTPICVGIKALTFVRCRFVRCVPPADSERIDCRADQRPHPPEPARDEIVTVRAVELAPIVEAARDGERIDVTDFCRKHGLALEARR